MTAQHAAAGALDATLPDLGAGVAWESGHRARPRAPLTGRGCGGPVHAKVSRGGLRFFAHDARPADCHLLGEGIAHRLLKDALAAAARQAGWTAELEAAGEGWRADVLTTSPDGERRIAWEAQLAAITPDEVVRRHDTMTASGLLVCWVSDRDRPWTLAVPDVVVAPPEQPDDEESVAVDQGRASW